MRPAFETASIFTDISQRDPAAAQGMKIPARSGQSIVFKRFPIRSPACDSAEVGLRLDPKTRNRQEFHQINGPIFRQMPKIQLST